MIEGFLALIGCLSPGDSDEKQIEAAKAAAAEALTRERERHEKLSKIIHGQVILLAGICFYSIVAINGSDHDLLTRDPKLQLPFASVATTFAAYVFLAPVIIFAFSLYMQIYIRELRRSLIVQPPGIYIFNFSNGWARLVRTFIFYLLGPLTIHLIALKSIPLPGSGYIVFFSCFSTIVYLILFRQEATNHYLRRAIIGLIILYSAVGFAQAFAFRPFAQLVRLSLPQTSLIDREIVGFYLANADLHESDFSGSNLSCTNFSGADMIRSQLKGVNFYRADLSGSILTMARLEDSSLLKANLEYADMGSAVLKNVRVVSLQLFDEKNLNNFENLYRLTRREGAVWSRLCEYDHDRSPTNAIGPATVQEHPLLWEPADIRQYIKDTSKFAYGFFNHTSFLGAKISDSDFRSSLFVNADFSAAEVFDTNFRYSDFSDATLRDAYFQESDMRRSYFVSAKAARAIFAGVNMRGANFQEARLVGAIFIGSDLKGADFRKAELDGASFIGVNLDGADFRKTSVENVTFGEGTDKQGAIF